MLALGVGVLVYTILYKAWLFVASLLSGYFIGIPNEVFLLIFPDVSLAFLFRVLFSAEIAALSAIAATVIVGLMTEGNFALAGYALFSSFIGIVAVRKFEQRTAVLKAGFYTGLFQMFFASAVVLAKIYTLNFSWHHVAYSLLAGFLSGVISTLVAEAIVPIFEYLFNYTTNLKLLEFANSTNIIMRDLLVKAPGTYHHSMLVGQLAGAGAEAIGANALLARVGAFYHDIGKIGKAQYFIENQSPGINPHNKLNPTMSARILVSHVRDGVKLAKDNKLGSAITDIVEQHHGTSLMKFFYGKAIELNKDQEQVKVVDPMDYRYPGPKPKSREAILVMIADSCEAACRSLEDPTPARIQTTVNTIINNMFVDGQFDESNITLKRLKIISQVYTKTLISINHTRIEYPEIKAEERYGDFSERRKWDKVTQEISDTDGTEGSPETSL
jgi:putative nucleotidyltransferase with HDIG domain